MLLEALHLEDYKKAFEDELITGEILAECNEDVLKEDLGIKNRVHISKLMAVIKGQYSAQALLTDDKYVRFLSQKTTVV